MYFLVLLLMAIQVVHGKINPYCAICQDHTMCQFEGRGKACENYGEGGVTEEHKTIILDTHNWYRRLVAEGHEIKGLNGSQPKASNLRKLTWDNELAEVAQRWADQCLFQHDSCRHDPRWRVGQNIYWNWRFPVIKTVNWTAAIASWYDEVGIFDPKLVDSYKFDPETGHYTQMMWHDTHKIGCGRRNYGPNKIYICNYGPAGNWIDDPMYAVGEPCSNCPTGTYCDEGLCDDESNKPVTSNYSPTKIDVQTKSDTLDSFVDYLTPPKKDAVSVYEKQSFKLNPKISLAPAPIIIAVEKDEEGPENRFSLLEDPDLSALVRSTEEGTTTELPVDYNIIDDLELAVDDDEIRKEVEDLKIRIRELVKKIVKKRTTKH